MAAEEVPRLRPLSRTDVLDELFALYRRGFKTFAGIAAVVNVPLAILSLAFVPFMSTIPQLSAAGRDPTPQFWAALGTAAVAFLIFMPVAVVGSILEEAATCYATSAYYLGEKLTVREAYRLALAHFWPLLRLSLLLGLLLVGVPLLGFLPVIFPPLLCLSLPLAALFICYLGVRWSVAIPGMVLEQGRSAVGALQRSWLLTTDAWWRTFSTLLILWFLVGILQSIATGLVSALTAGAQFASATAQTTPPLWVPILNSLLSSLIGILFGPLIWIGVTLIYYDRRIRVEAYDLAIMARELGRRPEAEPPPL